MALRTACVCVCLETASMAPALDLFKLCRGETNIWVLVLVLYLVYQVWFGQDWDLSVRKAEFWFFDCKLCV